MAPPMTIAETSSAFISSFLLLCIFFSAALCPFAISAFPFFVTVYRLFAVGQIVSAISRATVNGCEKIR